MHCVVRGSGLLASQPTSHARHLSSDAGQLSRRAKANQALPTLVSPLPPFRSCTSLHQL